MLYTNAAEIFPKLAVSPTVSEYSTSELIGGDTITNMMLLFPQHGNI